MARRVIEAEQAQRVAPAAPAPAADEQGDDGLVTVKTRLPLHLHIPFVNLAELHGRSVAAELRVAVQQYLERELRR